MGEVVLVRHAQASFGGADYDVLSERGHRQSRALGRALETQGLSVDRAMIGAQRRHRETYDGMAEALDRLPEPERHEGLNEFDFGGLLAARFREGRAPEGMNRDRRTHFLTLRDTVLMWQRDEITAPPEAWPDFRARVGDALAALAGRGTALAVSSGGPISLILVQVLESPEPQMIRLQLQMKNCAVSRLIAGGSGIYLHGFNETPHIDAANADSLLTYS